MADALSRVNYDGQEYVDEDEEPDKHCLVVDYADLDEDGRPLKKQPTTIGMEDHVCPIDIVPREASDSEDSEDEQTSGLFKIFDHMPRRNKAQREKSNDNRDVHTNMADHQDSQQDLSQEEVSQLLKGDDNEEMDVDPLDEYGPSDVDELLRDDEGLSEGLFTEATRTGRHMQDDGQNTKEQQANDWNADKLEEFLDRQADVPMAHLQGRDKQSCLDLYESIMEQARTVAIEQAVDKDWMQLYNYKLHKHLPIDMKLARKVMAEEDKYYLSDQGLLYRRFHAHPGEEVFHQLCLPSKYRPKVTALFHHGLFGAHRGFNSLFYTVRKKFYWPNMYEELQQFVLTCQTCAMAKRDYSHMKTPLQLRPPTHTFQVVHMDVLKVAPTTNGESKVLVIVDRFSKHYEICALKDEKAETIAEKFMELWIQRYGPPKMVILDSAAAHTSKAFKTLAELFNINLRFIISWHAQSNAAVERLHSNILTALRTCMREYPDRPWTEFLSHVRWAHDVSVQPNGFTPFEIMYGMEPSLTGDLETDPPVMEDLPPADVLPTIWPDLAAIRSAAQKNARVAAERMKARYDSAHRTGYKSFIPGDLVWVRSPRSFRPDQYKIAVKYVGPFTVMAEPRPGAYLLRFQNKIWEHLIHEERLKRYVPEDASNLRMRLKTEYVPSPLARRTERNEAPPARQSGRTQRPNMEQHDSDGTRQDNNRVDARTGRRQQVVDSTPDRRTAAQVPVADHLHDNMDPDETIPTHDDVTPGPQRQRMERKDERQVDKALRRRLKQIGKVCSDSNQQRNDEEDRERRHEEGDNEDRERRREEGNREDRERRHEGGNRKYRERRYVQRDRERRDEQDDNEHNERQNKRRSTDGEKKGYRQNDRQPDKMDYTVMDYDDRRNRERYARDSSLDSTNSAQTGAQNVSRYGSGSNARRDGGSAMDSSRDSFKDSPRDSPRDSLRDSRRDSPITPRRTSNRNDDGDSGLGNRQGQINERLDLRDKIPQRNDGSYDDERMRNGIRDSGMRQRMPPARLQTGSNMPLSNPTAGQLRPHTFVKLLNQDRCKICGLKLREHQPFDPVPVSILYREGKTITVMDDPDTIDRRRVNKKNPYNVDIVDLTKLKPEDPDPLPTIFAPNMRSRTARARFKHSQLFNRPTMAELQGHSVNHANGQAGHSSAPVHDFTQLLKVKTAKQLKKGRTMLCEWRNRRPSWLPEAIIPRYFVNDYDNRTRARDQISRMKRHAF